MFQAARNSTDTAPVSTIYMSKVSGCGPSKIGFIYRVNTLSMYVYAYRSDDRSDYIIRICNLYQYIKGVIADEMWH